MRSAPIARGQNNLWVMDADGSNPKAVLSNKDARRRARVDAGRPLHPVRRSDVRPGQGGGGSGLWMYPRDGGEGVELVGREPRGAANPTASADGSDVYFSINAASAGTWSGRRVMQARSRFAGWN